MLNFSWSALKRVFFVSVTFGVWEEQVCSHTNCLMYIPGTCFGSWTYGYSSKKSGRLILLVCFYHGYMICNFSSLQKKMVIYVFNKNWGQMLWVKYLFDYSSNLIWDKAFYCITRSFSWTLDWQWSPSSCVFSLFFSARQVSSCVIDPPCL